MSARSVWRHEYKYVIDSVQREILMSAANAVMVRDPYVRSDGRYTIRSLYFDDHTDTCLSENLSGTDPRSKFRIRYYNDDRGRLIFEKKNKCRGLCKKESCIISKEECEDFLSGKVPDLSGAPEVKTALFSEIAARCMYPKVIVTYERTPFVYSAGNVRITFDDMITSSAETDGFLSQSYGARPILPFGCSIMEVKWDDHMPGHIKEVMQLSGLTWTAFSKYSMCRKIMQALI